MDFGHIPKSLSSSQCYSAIKTEGTKKEKLHMKKSNCQLSPPKQFFCNPEDPTVKRPLNASHLNTINQPKMEVYSRTEVGSNMKSSSLVLSGFTSSSFPTPNQNPSSQEQSATQNATPEQEPDEGSGEKFGIILSRGRSVSASSRSFKYESQGNAQSAVRRAFSMRKSCPVGDGYSRILEDPCESSSPPPQDLYVRTGSKKRRIKIFRACKRLLGFA